MKSEKIEMLDVVLRNIPAMDIKNVAILFYFPKGEELRDIFGVGDRFEYYFMNESKDEDSILRSKYFTTNAFIIVNTRKNQPITDISKFNGRVVFVFQDSDAYIKDGTEEIPQLLVEEVPKSIGASIERFEKMKAEGAFAVGEEIGAQEIKPLKEAVEEFINGLGDISKNKTTVGQDHDFVVNQKESCEAALQRTAQRNLVLEARLSNMKKQNNLINFKNEIRVLEHKIETLIKEFCLAHNCEVQIFDDSRTEYSTDGSENFYSKTKVQAIIKA